MKLKYSTETKAIIQAKMNEIGTNNINDVIENFVQREQNYEKRIQLLQGAIKHYEEALNVKSE